MKNIIKLIVIVSALVAVASCDLALTPKGSITYNPGDQIITSRTDLEGFEANVMSSLRSLEYGDYDIPADVMVDYFNATSDYGNNYGSIHRTDDTFTAGDYDSEYSWENPYLLIKNFNIFIEGAQSVPSDLINDAAVARGEAYFGRAFAYLHMARIFGKAYSSSAGSDLCVPIVTAYEQNERPARATVAEVYAQIKLDLDSAALLLAGKTGAVRAQRPTIDAVNALYARYFIDIKDYNNAASSATKVINTNNYSLSSTAEEMEKEWINDEGNEPILQYFASTTEGVGIHEAYTLSSAGDYPLYYRPYFIPSKKLIEAYEEGDLRLAQWFNNETPVFMTGSYYNVEQPEFYTFVKYYGNPKLITGLPNSQQAIKPLLISEMYLIAAEAYANAGNSAEAQKYLNILQEKRGATKTSGTLDNVKNEWYKETVGEGLRMSCLKRWGDGFNGRAPQDGASNIVMKGTHFDAKNMSANDYHFQWPVPTYEIQTNLNLVQNEGYEVN